MSRRVSRERGAAEMVKERGVHRRETSVSVVVPVYDGGENFRVCLDALATSDPPPLEIIVVDDGSSDSSASDALSRGYPVLRTPSPRRGPAAARNLGAKEARGEILLFIDADVAVRPSTVGQVALTFADRPEIDALFGSYDDRPAAAGFVSQYKNLFHHYVHQRGRAEAATFWAGCGAVRRPVFLSRGGFDGRKYPRPSIEDIEFGYRLRKAGGRILLDGTLQVKHLKEWSFPSLLRSDIFDRGIPWSMLLGEGGAAADDLNLKSASRYSIVLLYCSLAALLLYPLFPKTLWAAGAGFALVLALNWDLYRWFAEQRGLLFALRALPLHWLYYFYCGLAFAAGKLTRAPAAR